MARARQEPACALEENKEHSTQHRPGCELTLTLLPEQMDMHHTHGTNGAFHVSRKNGQQRMTDRPVIKVAVLAIEPD